MVKLFSFSGLTLMKCDKHLLKWDCFCYNSYFQLSLKLTLFLGYHLYIQRVCNYNLLRIALALELGQNLLLNITYLQCC